MFKKTNPILDCVILAVVFFGVAFLTRMPAMMLWQSNYGIHGLLAGPFFAFIVAFYTTGKQKAWPAIVGALACAAVLGIMSPVMLFSIAVPAVLGGLAYVIVRQVKLSWSYFACALAFGCFSYPATFAAGFLFSSYYGTGEVLLSITAFTLIGVCLCVITTFFGASFALRGKTDSTEGEIVQPDPDSETNSRAT